MSDLLQWLNANPGLAGVVTFTVSAAESIAIIGTIIPGTVAMTAIGTLAGAGVIPLFQTLLWAILGAVVGDGISYWIGRYFNNRLPNMWPFRTHPNLLGSGEAFFRKHGWMSVFIGRFVGPVRALVPLVAGMLKMSPLRFTIANILSAIGWAPAYMLPGILLGAASLELPPDVAVHVILMLLLVGLLIIFCIWLVQKIFKLIGHRVNDILTVAWESLSHSRRFKVVTKALKHHNIKKTYGQLTLAFYFVIVCMMIIYLTTYVSLAGSPNIFINTVFFHFFRSLRSPLGDNIMLAITFLGEKFVLLPLIATLFVWFAWTKRWHTAWHILGLGILGAAGVEVLKHFTHSPRPWGILENSTSYSYPSGHATLAVIFYMGLAFLLTKAWKLKPHNRRKVYTVAGLLIIAITCSRLYLGAHWFTDVLAGWLLGIAVLMLISLSYNRKSEKHLYPTGILITIILTLCVTYSTALYLKFDKLKHNYTQLDWPVNTVPLQAWWDWKGNHLPLYRINRFGLSKQILNIQWLENIDTIKSVLQKNGWQMPPDIDLITVLHRLSDVESAEHLPLVSPLYLDKQPVLVLIRHINGKKLLVLRLWDSNVVLNPSNRPLWVGTVEIVPRTYSWLFKRRHPTVDISTNLVLPALSSSQYDVKELHLDVYHTYGPRNQTILLIKPKSK